MVGEELDTAVGKELAATEGGGLELAVDGVVEGDTEVEGVKLMRADGVVLVTERKDG